MESQLYLRGTLVLSLFIFAACIKRNYSNPETTGATASVWRYRTIAELKNTMGTYGAKEITEACLIRGMVIANDESGNFYKQIIIDDGTAAIPILLDGYSLYASFPVGRMIQVRCQGLYTSFSNKLPQLGYAPNTQGTLLPIPVFLWDRFILKESNDQKPEPVKVLLSEVRKALPELFNRLVVLDSVEFADTTELREFAVDPDLSSATNLTLRDCDSNIILLRTSGYCRFATALRPKGRGRLTAIYSVYNSTPQLILRDTSDIRFLNERCQ